MDLAMCCMHDAADKHCQPECPWTPPLPLLGKSRHTGIYVCCLINATCLDLLVLLINSGIPPVDARQD